MTPVPIGTICCRFWSAISIWLVPRTSGSKAVSNMAPEKSGKRNIFRCDRGERNLQVQDDRTRVDKVSR